MELHPDWKEFLELLMRHGVRFVIVGGHAVAANGRPRYTEDLDVFVDRSEANARRLGRVLAEFGLANTARAWRQFTRPNKILFIGVPPLRIDVLTSISGVTFAEAWKGRLVATTDLGAIPTLGLTQLRLNKAASGRPKDLADLAILAELHTSRNKPSPSQRKRRVRRNKRG